MFNNPHAYYMAKQANCSSSNRNIDLKASR